MTITDEFLTTLVVKASTIRERLDSDFELDKTADEPDPPTSDSNAGRSS